MPASTRWYRWLLRLYPAGFREEYAGPMERHLADEYRDAGGWQRAAVTARTIIDVAGSLPQELARELRQDLIFACRLHRKRALSTALAMIALVIAVGAATGVFSVLSALLLRQLPFGQPERLVAVQALTLLHGGKGLEQWARDSAYLTAATDFQTFPMNVSQQGDAVRANVAIAAPNFFDVLGVGPHLGRTFAPGESDRDVAVIGHSLWQQFLGAHPVPIGQILRLNGTPVTVIGVAPPGFDYPAKTTIWTTRHGLPMRGAIGGGVIARLRDGIALEDARALFHAEVGRSYPAGVREQWAPRARLDPLRERLAGPVKQASLVLLGIVGLVLLIACSSVAQLFVARMRDRREELALRTALGASRARLVQQLTTEAMVFTIAAAIGGLMVAYWVARLASAAQAPQLATQEYTLLDWRVVGFCATVAVVTGVTFGVLPGISRATRATGFERHARIRPATVVLQVALTAVLVASAVTLGRAFIGLLQTDLGFRTDRVVTLNVSLLGTPHEDDQKRYYHEALDRLRATPGVESAGAVNYLPLMPNNYINAPVERLDGATQLPIPMAMAAAPGYFKTMGIPVVAGREFSDGDRSGASGVVIVNEEFGRISGLGLAVVGRSVDLAYSGRHTIVGIVRDILLTGPTDRPQPHVYLPFDQLPTGPGFMTFVARVREDAASAVPILRGAVQQIDPTVPVYDVKTLDQRLADHLARPQFYTTGILLLTAFAVMVSMIGIYGITAYTVTQRMKEIGIRIAIGAHPLHVRQRLILQGLTWVVMGIGVGVAGVYASAPLLAYLIPSAPPNSASAVTAAALVPMLTGGLALWAATDRITQSDPAATLRAD